MEGTLAIVCAMPLELASVVRAAHLRKQGGERWGVVGDRAVVAVATGMGTVLARSATERLLRRHQVGHVLVSGIAGGVDTAVAIGTVVRPEVVIDAATGDRFTPDPLGAPAVGALWTTDVITPAAEVAELRTRGIVALDMETAAIGAVCDEQGVPWSVFRAISDDPSDEVDEELFKMSNQDGTPNPRNVARYLARHPGRLPRLARMGKNSKVAADAAAAAALDACRGLA